MSTELLQYWIKSRADAWLVKHGYLDESVLDYEFKTFRFTNIDRKIDRSSLWMIRNIIENDELDPAWEAFNIFAFRRINLPETADYFLPVKSDEEVMELYTKEVPPTLKFSSAYMLSGPMQAANKYCEKVGLGHLPLLSKMVISAHHDLFDVIEEVFLADTAEEAIKSMSKVYSSVNFLAGQLWLDFAYSPRTKYEPTDYFIRSLKGTTAGLKFIAQDAGLDIKDYDEFILQVHNEIKDMGAEQLKRIRDTGHPDGIIADEEWTLWHTGNSLCEYSKYYKLLNELPCKRRLYKPK